VRKLRRVAIRSGFISANSYRKGHTPTAVVPVIALFTAMRIQFEHGSFDSSPNILDWIVAIYLDKEQ